MELNEPFPTPRGCCEGFFQSEKKSIGRDCWADIPPEAILGPLLLARWIEVEWSTQHRENFKANVMF